jgi:hypothetical protein
MYLRIVGKYPQTTKVEFLFADLSHIKFDTYLKLLATNTCERINIDPEDLTVEDN